MDGSSNDIYLDIPVIHVTHIQHVFFFNLTKHTLIQCV